MPSMVLLTIHDIIELSLEVLDVSNADAYVSARLKWMDIIIGNLPAIRL